jgi:urease accessory protein
LLHPPGGVVLGDELRINATVHSGAALLTTPSAGRFYSVGEHTERQRQSVQLDVRGGLLEWLPQETILFSGANARLYTRIDLHAGARLAFWDVVVMGRPACGESFECGRLDQRLDLHLCGRPLLSERLQLAAGDRISRSRIGLHGASTLGIALFSDLADESDVDTWLSAQHTRESGAFSVTQREGLLIARYRGDDAYRCRQGFAALWSATSRARDGVGPEIPRIWHT